MHLNPKFVFSKEKTGRVNLRWMINGPIGVFTMGAGGASAPPGRKTSNLGGKDLYESYGL